MERRPLDTVMKEIAANLEEKGFNPLPNHILKAVAERHEEDVQFGEFLMWKKHQIRMGKEVK